jgi:heparosan-N-sulfate-glucuronate 5-epimerase
LAEPNMPRKAAELPGVFSSASVMSLPLGEHIDADGVRGYPVDMRVKAQDPKWPPWWLSPTPQRLWVASVQLGLGAHEHWLAGEGDEWLQTAVDCADDLAGHQRGDGAWPHGYDYPHTFALGAGWISAIAQGQAASFFVRVHAATGDERYAGVARSALHPMTTPAGEGGCLALLGGGPFPEEYPTKPPSYVLNGGLFATWGFRDVAVALGDEPVRRLWEDMAATLRDNLRRWDTGWWSRYDLFPHPVKNVASSFYHDLHITQLRGMALLTGESEFTATADRWAGYAASRANSARAFAAKAAFRVAVPRNRLLAKRLPWGASAAGRGR